MNILDKIELAWSPVKNKDVSYLEALVIGGFFGLLIFSPILLLIHPVAALYLWVCIYYVLRFPKASGKIFGIKPNDKEV